MIDFSAINAFAKGQRESFEELVCVLARRERPELGIEYQPNEGKGGDGGVEAIWLLSDGGKIGYQAKFFLSLTDVQWRQMDESVQQALNVHPELKTYVFALPKNLTPKRGGKGKSEWEKWVDRVKTWKSWAPDKSIKFTLWSETNLIEMLLKAENLAMVEYWFGHDVLNNAWFQNQVYVASETLEDRFNPEDHVEIRIESLFDALARGPVFTERLMNAFDEMKKLDIPKVELLSKHTAPFANALISINMLRKRLVESASIFQHDFNQKWDMSTAAKIEESLRSEIWSFENQYGSIDKKELKESDNDVLMELRKYHQKVVSACYALKDIFSALELKAEQEQCALIYGAAGAGKSHILGQIAVQRINNGLPTILLLGQSFSNSVFGEQLGALLGLKVRALDDILGILNAAGERLGERTILLFDAINEGAGAQYWRQNLTEVVKTVKKYPYLSVVFSCREEYLSYAIPKSLQSSISNFCIKGFSTPDEIERAAIRYLDSKGIARPNTPWLSPEFSNPLFLKTTSEALHSKGETEFPRGLTGISQIMALYLDALSSRVGMESISAKLIASSIKKCVNKLAKKMAADKCDFVELELAVELTEECFKGRVSPKGKTWLDVLIEASLFRRDPPPYTQNIDYLNPPSELVRFAFQRFQDHLMAITLVDQFTLEQASNVFDDDGLLRFLFYDGNSENKLRYEYAGLISALSTIYPEKIGLEFVKTLPKWELRWKEEQLLQEGFAESFKWRSAFAFSDSTSELWHKLDSEQIDPFALLLEVSMTIEHPFNAFWLHSHLKNYSMPQRDSYWTRWVNWSSREQFSQINRIVSWALSVSEQTADSKHMELAAIALVWSLSSSHMTLRDKATKALTKLFLTFTEAYQLTLDKMFDCDDPYILERLYAAAFGACCIDQSTQRLHLYAKITFEKVFAGKNPPIGLLTRDYTLGIIELSHSKGVPNTNVCIDMCYPPFNANPANLKVSVDEVEAIAKKSGGNEIFNSASSEWGDYGKYSIPGRVSSFLKTPLDKLPPVSKAERKTSFIVEVINPHKDRTKALLEFDSACDKINREVFKRYKENNNKEAADYLNKLEVKKAKTLDALKCLFNKEEEKRFIDEYLGNSSNESYIKIDVQQCRLWITKRAYELGWNSKLFPRDGHGASFSRHENDLERIGKKYQRIALDELQARLADNYWILGGWPAQPCVYRYSHSDYRRNLEPTILPHKPLIETENKGSNNWMFEPIIQLPEVAEENLKLWPFEENPTDMMEHQLTRSSSDGKSWIVLYEYNGDTQKYEEPYSGEHGFRYEEFRFIHCLFLKRGKAGQLVSFLDSTQRLDGHYLKPVDFIDGPFLREAHWRETWCSEKYSDSIPNAPKGCEFAIPVADFGWESHLDKSLPKGFSQYIPQKWFADELEVVMSRDQTNLWLDNAGEIVVRASEPFSGNKVVVIDSTRFDAYISKFQVEPVWFMIAERSHWPSGSNSSFFGRRAEGIVWNEAGSWQQVDWKRDTKR